MEATEVTEVLSLFLFMRHKVDLTLLRRRKSNLWPWKFSSTTVLTQLAFSVFQSVVKMNRKLHFSWISIRALAWVKGLWWDCMNTIFSEKRSSIVSLSPHYYICKSGEIDKANWTTAHNSHVICIKWLYLYSTTK